ncbi:MAG: NusA-like transcription termination signal-binding factor [Candidatus Altiarchaeales archaeon]|nr:MAG: NusA-like transcription termination signal-binding factor [Candidatus Altiarchaeales archaeon]
MAKIRLGSEEIKYITLFESITGARVKDCVTVENSAGFLVEKGDMGLAIGKNGSNIERVRRIISKIIWVMEYSDDINEFIRNLFHPVKIRQIRIREINGDKIAIVEVNKRDRRRLIGQDGSRIKVARELANRHFEIEDIKINAK